MKYVYPAVFTLLPDDEYDTHSGFTLLHYMRQKHDRRYRNGREMLLLCGLCDALPFTHLTQTISTQPNPWLFLLPKPLSTAICNNSRGPVT